MDLKYNTNQFNTHEIDDLERQRNGKFKNGENNG